MRRTAIQGLLSRFRWSPGPFIFDEFLGRFEAGSLSTFFSKSNLQKSKIPPLPRGVALGGQRGEVMTPTDANPAIASLNANLGAWVGNWGLGLAFWGLDYDSGPWTGIQD